MGDDVDPHMQQLEVPDGLPLRQALPLIAEQFGSLGTNAAWSVHIDGTLAAVEARLPGEPVDRRFLLDPDTPFKSAKVFYRYFMQRNADEVLALLDQERP